MEMRKRRFLSLVFSITAGFFSLTGIAFAHAPSGAIFTTLPDGSEVNANIYASKDDVYLDGGPGPGAPATAAGLDDGTYVFQVTDPSGKVLLSTDPAKCRQFEVVGGLISAVVVTGCEHLTGLDIDHGATTVQLMPYLDTPNPGGVYKAWVVRVGDFLIGCNDLGVADGLEVVDCGNGHGNKHGFVPAHTKTDNFKVGNVHNLEIDTEYYDAATGQLLTGLGQTWTDTLGSTNKKHSYSLTSNGIGYVIAHIEAVEAGVHQVTVEDQPGCKVVSFFCDAYSCGKDISIDGPGTIAVKIRNNDPKWTHYLTVYCDTTE